ncbi:energy transducer TonB [Lysobacter sp. A3-1-A15]|uniref:energy transducer TonB n=1 Tax=Novilysobacter viscosus TaxID=3098602 RepID=UPI002ED80F5C
MNAAPIAVPAHVPLRDTAERRLDPGRITANTLAICLHLVAGMLLMAPLAVGDWQVPRTIAEPIEWIPREPLKPVDPPPVEATTRPPTAPSVPAPALPRAVPVVAPVAPMAGDPPADEQTTATFETRPRGPSLPADPTPSISTGVTLEYAHAPAPRYPVRALRDGRGGVVVLEVLVDVDGRPLEVSIVRSSGHRDLDRAAQRQVEQSWRFQPAMRDGVAVRAIGRIPVEFNPGR